MVSGTKGQLLQHVRHIGTLEGKAMSWSSEFQPTYRVAWSQPTACLAIIRCSQVTGLQTEANFLKGRIGELQARHMIPV